MIITTIEQLKENIRHHEDNVLIVSNALINLEAPDESPIIREISRIVRLNPDNCLRIGSLKSKFKRFTIYFNKLSDPTLTQIGIIADFGWAFRDNALSKQLPSAETYFTYFCDPEFNFSRTKHDLNTPEQKIPPIAIRIFHYSLPTPLKHCGDIKGDTYEEKFHLPMLERFKQEMTPAQSLLPRSYSLSKEFFNMPSDGGNFIAALCYNYPGGILYDFITILHNVRKIPKIFVHGYIKKSARYFVGYKVILAEQKLSHAVDPDDQLIFIIISDIDTVTPVPEVEISGPISASVRPRIEFFENAAAMYHPAAASVQPRPTLSMEAAAAPAPSRSLAQPPAQALTHQKKSSKNNLCRVS